MNSLTKYKSGALTCSTSQQGVLEHCLYIIKLADNSDQCSFVTLVVDLRVND